MKAPSFCLNTATLATKTAHRSALALLMAMLLNLQSAETPSSSGVTPAQGELEQGKARLVIEANLPGFGNTKPIPLFTSTLEHSLHLSPGLQSHSVHLTFDILQGEPTELPVRIEGEGDIVSVSGPQLLDWSIRQSPTQASRILILRPSPSSPSKPITHFEATITARVAIHSTLTPSPLSPLLFIAANPSLSHGHLRITFDPQLHVQAVNPKGLIPLEPGLLPETMIQKSKPRDSESLAYRFQGAAHSLQLLISPADPEARRVVLRQFQLKSTIHDDSADFILTAIAHCSVSNLASLRILSGQVGLVDTSLPPGVRLALDQGSFVLRFDQPGEFPIRIRFNAAVKQHQGWYRTQFTTATAAMLPVTIEGLPRETELEWKGAAQPAFNEGQFTSFLPPDGQWDLAWRKSRTESEGKLFYSAEALSQISVGSGQAQQTALLEFKVMQGELDSVRMRFSGPGNVTSVQGTNVLSWNVELQTNGSDPLLHVRFNRPQKDSFHLQIQIQNDLAALPQSIIPARIQPLGAIRFAGHLRIVNEGAVKLEVTQSKGLSQVSPEQFPESAMTQSLLTHRGTQRFVYRFSSTDYALQIMADHILPELGVSHLISYHLGESEMALDAELELEIREAPLRDLVLRIPKGFAIAHVHASGLNDYVSREIADQPYAELRLVFSQPVGDRQLVQLRLERNTELTGSSWDLPRVELPQAKSTRGHIAVSADAGLRLTPDRTVGLIDIATAFYPKKTPGIQAAFRMSDPLWQASLRVERIPQTLQADVFHLFSIGEGIAYGSSTINYLISGAPISSLRVELSEEYSNVEFIGKDVRNWQRTTNGWLVQLHAPVSGSYTLLASCERAFKPSGDTLTFTGARPLDAQTEQGHTLVVSTYPFKVTPTNLSPSLTPLETTEVPAEYRLFFDAPILAAYHYTARPFQLSLALTPLAQAETLALVIDRATFQSRISKEGEILTDARYYIKNRGTPHLRITLPPDTALWSATIQGITVTPIQDGTTQLIPLPQRNDPNAVQTLDLKLASRSKNPGQIIAGIPGVAAPVLLAEWNLEPDTGMRLIYQRGSLIPAGGVADNSGFADLARFLKSTPQVLLRIFLALVLLILGIVILHWASRPPSTRYSVRHLGGTLCGVTALILTLTLTLQMRHALQSHTPPPARSLNFVAPVQQSGDALSLQIANVLESAGAASWLGMWWPSLLGLGIGLYALRLPETSIRRLLELAAAWTLCIWGCLRAPDGAGALPWVLIAFTLIHFILPAVIRVWSVPPGSATSPQVNPGPNPPTSPAPAATASVLLLLLSACPGWTPTASAQSVTSTQKPPSVHPAPSNTPQADSLIQEVRVNQGFALIHATLRWQALKGQSLAFLSEPAVLTGMNSSNQNVRIFLSEIDGKRTHQMLALIDGWIELDFNYQLQLQKSELETGFQLNVPPTLIHHLSLDIPEPHLEIHSPQAVSVSQPPTAASSDSSPSRTRATLVLSPTAKCHVLWKPRSRDVKNEASVFFAEWFQLFAASQGSIEGVHQLNIRPAQGELLELQCDVPPGITITDVLDFPPSTTNTLPSLVSLWRFDPDQHRLRIQLATPQSKAFSLAIRSQLPTTTLPAQLSLSAISIQHASAQMGSVGIATGNEIQLDQVQSDALSAINLEDFPSAPLIQLAPPIQGLTLRRAFRYPEANRPFTLQVSAVEPDVRVETQETLSLGEDRTLLAAHLQLNITRAGIFRASFLLPNGLEVESVSGSSLSHWTELKSDDSRSVTLHLKGKTEGLQSFAVTLSGPGLKSTNRYTVPRLTLREATKQRGQLVIAPEQGIRLQVASRDGVTQLDPQKAGIRQKGVLAFTLLQPNWNLNLDLEQVDPWIQTLGLQHASISEAQAKLTANFQYQIENTGIKSFRVALPISSLNVRFQGDQVADFMPLPNTLTNGMQVWEIKLHRRVTGKHQLQATWQQPLSEGLNEWNLQGAQTLDASLQRGFVTVQSVGRIQVRVGSLPSSLQSAEWQSIPKTLQQDLQPAAAHLTYRLVDPTFQLPVQLQRHQAAKLLPARVQQLQLQSVISDEGVMLTQVKLTLIPGDKRLLAFTLPSNASFWFAFVNQHGVWPWRETNQTLIPLEQASRTDQPTTVEWFYSSRIGSPGNRQLNLSLHGPQFDLPLENITWQVYLNEKWRLADWQGTLQLQQDHLTSAPATIDLQTYLSEENRLNQEKTKAAEQMLALGQNLLEKGDPQQARRAFQSAFGLSAHNNAFNEDARVQLHNLKLQQALIGLNVRQTANANANANTGEQSQVPGNLRDLRNRTELSYTQQEAKQVLDNRSADDNAALARLAERLVQQQDAAVSAPAAIHASIPTQGRLLTFHRTVQVDTFANLNLQIQATAQQAASSTVRWIMLASGFALLILLLATSAANTQRLYGNRNRRASPAPSES